GVRGDRHTDLAAGQLSTCVLDRISWSTLEEPVPAAGDRPLLRHLPDPHAGVGDYPFRRRPRGEDPEGHPRVGIGRAAACNLGSPQQYMIGNVIQSKFLQLTDYPQAAALSFVLMAAIMAAVIVYARLLGTERLTG